MTLYLCYSCTFYYRYIIVARYLCIFFITCILMTQRMYTYIAEYWGTENGGPPPDIPICGLKNENCPEDSAGK